MCFSATASFAGATILWLSWIYTLSQVKDPRHEGLMASIPLLFAAQQAAEGMLWLALGGHPARSPYTHLLTTTFLIFAQIIWPIVVPLTVYMYERDAQRKQRLWWLVAIWFILGTYLATCMVLFSYSSHIQEHHIAYTLPFPRAVKRITDICYVLVIAFPLFFAKQKQARQMWIVLAISLVATSVLYSQYFVSVWCFFAALVSILIIIVLRTAHTESSVYSLQHIIDKVKLVLQ